MVGNGGGGSQRLDILGPRIDNGGIFLDISKISQRLNTASRRARPNGDEPARTLTDLANALGVVGRGYRAFDQGEVIAAANGGAHRFRKVSDLHGAGDSKQLILTVKQAELAAVARGEFPDRKSRPSLGYRHLQSSFRPSRGRTLSQRNTGPSRQTKTGPN